MSVVMNDCLIALMPIQWEENYAWYQKPIQLYLASEVVDLRRDTSHSARPAYFLTTFSILSPQVNVTVTLYQQASLSKHGDHHRHPQLDTKQMLPDPVEPSPSGYIGTTTSGSTNIAEEGMGKLSELSLL